MNSLDTKMRCLRTEKDQLSELKEDGRREIEGLIVWRKRNQDHFIGENFCIREEIQGNSRRNRNEKGSRIEENERRKGPAGESKGKRRIITVPPIYQFTKE